MGKDQLRQLTEKDLQTICPFLDFVGAGTSQKTLATTTFPIPDSLPLPLTKNLYEHTQVTKMLELFNTEPYHTRLLAVRMAQQESFVLIPGVGDVAAKIHELKGP